MRMFQTAAGLPDISPDGNTTTGPTPVADETLGQVNNAHEQTISILQSSPKRRQHCHSMGGAVHTPVIKIVLILITINQLKLAVLLNPVTLRICSLYACDLNRTSVIVSLSSLCESYCTASGLNSQTAMLYKHFWNVWSHKERASMLWGIMCHQMLRKSNSQCAGDGLANHTGRSCATTNHQSQGPWESLDSQESLESRQALARISYLWDRILCLWASILLQRPRGAIVCQLTWQADS